MKRMMAQLQAVTTKVKGRRLSEEYNLRTVVSTVDSPDVFVFEGNLCYDTADNECKGGGGVHLPILP